LKVVKGDSNQETNKSKRRVYFIKVFTRACEHQFTWVSVFSLREDEDENNGM